MKIPPPLLMVAAMAVTYLVDRADLDGSPLESTAGDIVGTVLGIAGLACALLGVQRFSGAGTTVDPHSIENASTLVVSGIYRFTRNPMYLGMVLLTTGLALRLGTALGLLVGSGLLMLALVKLQIEPEERVLGTKFGQSYERYRNNVRRWL